MADVSLDDLIKKDREKDKMNRMKQVLLGVGRSCRLRRPRDRGGRSKIITRTVVPGTTSLSSTNPSRSKDRRRAETDVVHGTTAEATRSRSLASKRRRKKARVRRRCSGRCESWD